MKIAILTQPLHNNYGGILQNYALQTVLRKMGHSPVTIDISYKSPKWLPHIRIIKYIWRFLKKLCGDKTIIYCDPKRQWAFLNHPGKEQLRFINSYINIMHMHEGLDEGFCKVHDFKVYLVGSDQVWRPCFSPSFTNFFLDFTSILNVKRLSYAASFGTDKWEGALEETPKITELIRKFDAISVREQTGIDICKDVFNVDAKWVLDPTLLLDKKEYDKLIVSYSRPSDKSYLAIYVLDNNPLIDRMVKYICCEYKFVPVYLGNPNKKGFPSIESWIAGIFYSDYVLTDSFHGTVFSIIAHKPFTTVVNNGRGASRFESLLGSLNLSERMTVDGSLKMHSSIDYNSVDQQLAKIRIESINFLQQSIDV